MKKFSWDSPLTIGLIFAFVKLLLHFISNSNYGYFRDELYFLACGEHLAWGYPDHSPLVALIAKLNRTILGESLFAIRFVSALAGAFKVFLTAVLVREFGGKRFATFLACLCVLCSPMFLVIDNLLSMNPLEPVFWMLCVFFSVKAIKSEGFWKFSPSANWILFGVFAGLGLMNKHSMLFFGAAIFLGLLLTNAKKILTDKYFWIGGAIALLIFSPNIIWQIQNDFATLELLQNVQKTGKNVVLSPLGVIVSQILGHNPFSFFVWLAGVWFLLFNSNGKRFRFLGLSCIFLLVLMIFLKAKDYYLAPIYPMLFAAGGIWWEQIAENYGKLRFFKYVLPTLIIALTLLVLPIALPVLPVETLIRYQEKMRLKPSKSEVSHEGVLQQVYGDQFGWEEMTAKVAEVYQSLPEDERQKTGIYASNYGEAGAIDFFGTKYGLPKAISPHQSYFLWGHRDYSGEVLILLGAKKENAEKVCESVEERGEVNHPYSMNEEKYKILVCRKTKKPLPEIWQTLKHWN